MAIIKKLTKRGFTLIELMIVVVIIGILASLAIYGVQKYVASSKSAEARTMLGRISKDMLSFFEGETQNSAVLKPGSSATISRALCPKSGNAVPLTVPSSAKTQPEENAFDDGEGWSCLGFQISTPVYYQYTVLSPQQTGSFSDNTLINADDGHTFNARATGDLDGDTVKSTFELEGLVDEEADGDLTLILATTVKETNPEE